ncbi:MAG: hypothetical protein ACRBBR_03190 [Cellvibrionaceae bacterium]
MKFIIATFGILLSLYCSGEQLISEDLHGYYTFKSGDPLFEEMFLKEDGNFFSWLHQRPGSTGTWVFKGKTVYVDANLGDDKIKFEVISLGKKEAVFKFEYSDGPATFTRSKK